MITEEKQKMTRTYKIAREIANEIVNVKKARYESLKERDFESYAKFDDLAISLDYALKDLGYEISSLEYGDSPVLFIEGIMAFDVVGANISKIKEEN